MRLYRLGLELEITRDMIEVSSLGRTGQGTSLVLSYKPNDPDSCAERPD